MDISSALPAVLGSALEPAADLTQALVGLSADIAAGVDGYHGLTLTVETHHGPVVLECLSDGEPRTSLRIVLPSGGVDRGPSILVLYSAVVGALADLAVDARDLLGSSARILVDHDLPGSVGVPWLLELHRRSVVDQAIGALIERGDSPDGADVELHRRASVVGRSVHQVAQELLDEIGHT